MSVIIHGMELPKSCDVCPFVHENDDLMSDDYRFRDCGFPGMGMFVTDFTACRLPDCQLHELSPHGRLIDADEFYKSLKKWYAKFYSAYEKDKKDERIAALLELDLAVRVALKGAPTIIPASEGKEE